MADEAYYLSLAQSFAAGQPAEHHPFWPPLYAESIGWLVRIFGPHRLPVQIIQIGLWLLAGGIYAWIGATVFQSRGVGITTLALFVLSPELMAFSHFLWPEILHLFLFGLILATFIRWPQHWLSFVSSGVWLGLAALTKSLLLPFVPVLGIFLYWQLEGAWYRRALRLGLLFVMCLLVLLPTLAANAPPS